jgi:TolB-like protein
MLYVASASAKSCRGIQTVVLLPVEQENVPSRSRISDRRLSEVVVTQLSRLKGFELVEFAELSKAFDDTIVDEAVFELLVTDDLKHTLVKLEDMETKGAKLVEYSKIGKEAGIDYLIDTSVRQDPTQLRITYKVITTETGRIVLAKSFSDVRNDPIGVSGEIAKRLIRSLWRLQHAGNQLH